MERRRAILVHMQTGEPLCPDWKPTIWPTELESANAGLAGSNMSYRWQWAGKLTTLHGSVEMQARSLNADVQLCPSGQRC